MLSCSIPGMGTGNRGDEADFDRRIVIDATDGVQEGVGDV
jgi:hypothetical protein